MDVISSAEVVQWNITNYGETPCYFRLYSNAQLFPYHGTVNLKPGPPAVVKFSKPAGAATHGIGYVYYPKSSSDSVRVQVWP